MNSTVVGVTASRLGLTEQQKAVASKILNATTELHHGDCTGGDYDLHVITRTVAPEAKIVIHPPEKEDLRAWCVGDVLLEPRGYRLRDGDIVAASHVLVAFPHTMFEITRSGTWMTVRIARSKRVNVVVVWPDGELTPGNKIEQTARSRSSKLLRA